MEVQRFLLFRQCFLEAPDTDQHGRKAASVDRPEWIKSDDPPLSRNGLVEPAVKHIADRPRRKHQRVTRTEYRCPALVPPCGVALSVVPVKMGGPQLHLGALRRIPQRLRRDAQAVVGSPYAALEHVRNAKLSGNRHDVGILAPE